MPLRALARVNLAAVQRNVARLREGLVGGANLCAVVKADGYGHGAVPVARAALAGGASMLAVATAGEAAELRAGGITSGVLVLGALSREELRTALEARAEVVAWSGPFVRALARAVSNGGTVRVHVKLDSGMGRLGTRERTEAVAVAEAVAAHEPRLVLAGAMTHFATADEDPEFLARQLAAFEPFAAEVRRRWPGALAHAANSAATLRAPEVHLDLVRTGIAIYGADPMHEDPAARGLEPALSLESYVAAVKRTQPGESAGYGRTFVASRETWLGTIPIGYGDGIRRALTNNADVLIGGRRVPLVGTVSMDNVTVDLGEVPGVSVGARAVFIGRSGEEVILAEEVARRLGTINYEVLCGISARVPRLYHRDGEPVR